MMVKDVEEQLLKERKCRRKPGQAVYPLEYTAELVDLRVISPFAWFVDLTVVHPLQ
jgi:hypothetical protein